MSNKKLCIISFLCNFVLPIVIFLIAGMGMNGDISGMTAAAYALMIPFDVAAAVAAWVFAIIARVKYKSKFSLVLIIIYSVLFVLWLPGNALILLLYIGSNF
ncbi:MAG: hypothetical protein K6A37_06275 [Saccharofermentans sp.]|nr:hypothetical protein [Saccharofermentans sp.]